MRILVHHRIASRDGQSVHLEELADALRRQGHELFLVGPSSFTDIKFGAAVNSIESLKRLIPKPAFELLEIAYNAVAFRRLRRAAKDFQPDVIYERFSLFLFCGMWVSRTSGIPILLEVNSPLFEERLATNALTLRSVGRRSQAWLFRRADAILPVTEVLANIICMYDVPRDKVHVVPNGANPGRLRLGINAESARRLVGTPDRLTIGFVGFVRKWNSVDKLVRFAAKYKDQLGLQILIVGDGPARSSIEGEAQRLGVSDRVTITGVVARDKVSTWISAMDIAVLPEVTEYSSPLKLFEYMYLGRAIAAPDLPNIREILTHDVDALLFGAGDGEMEEALKRLCDDKQLRDLVGRNAHEAVSRRQLTWDGSACKVIDVATNLTASRGRQGRAVSATPTYRSKLKFH